MPSSLTYRYLASDDNDELLPDCCWPRKADAFNWLAKNAGCAVVDRMAHAGQPSKWVIRSDKIVVTGRMLN